MTIRLVAVDLDGTLLRADGTVSERTRRSVERASRSGVLVVPATARPARWLESLGDVLGGVAICANGAVVYDIGARVLIDSVSLPPDLGHRLIGDIREALPGSVFALECLDGMRAEAGFGLHPDDARVGTRVRVGPVATLWDAPAVKLLVRSPGADHDHVVARVSRVVAKRAVVTWSEPGLAEIGAAGVTKAAALAKLCGQVGIHRSEVAAFGDMPNDLPMLARAGTSYAVANAHNDVLAAADHVVGSNDDDGVADQLDRIIDSLVGG